MIGVVLIFRRTFKDIDTKLLYNVIDKSEDIHFCIVSDRNSESLSQSFSYLEKASDKVSIIDIKMNGNKSVLLKAAFRYCRGCMDLNYIGYFEFKSSKDHDVFIEIIRSFNNDKYLLAKIKSWKKTFSVQRLIYKNVFSILKLFDRYYRKPRLT